MPNGLIAFTAMTLLSPDLELLPAAGLWTRLRGMGAFESGLVFVGFFPKPAVTAMEIA